MKACDKKILAGKLMGVGIVPTADWLASEFGVDRDWCITTLTFVDLDEKDIDILSNDYYISCIIEKCLDKNRPTVEDLKENEVLSVKYPYIEEVNDIELASQLEISLESGKSHISIYNHCLKREATRYIKQFVESGRFREIVGDESYFEFIKEHRSYATKSASNIKDAGVQQADIPIENSDETPITNEEKNEVQTEFNFSEYVIGIISIFLSFISMVLCACQMPNLDVMFFPTVVCAVSLIASMGIMWYMVKRISAIHFLIILLLASVASYFFIQATHDNFLYDGYGFTGMTFCVLLMMWQNKRYKNE